MAKFQKKPVVVEAMQFHGQGVGDATELLSWMGNAGEWDNETSQLEIHTLEGIMTASEGDWIIKGVNGEFYPCKPDIFEKTYSVVSDDPLDKLAEEHRQLLSKFSELAYFLDSEEYGQQPKKSRAILSRQYSALREHIFCLKEQLENNGCILFTGSNWPYLIEKFNGGVYQDDNTFLTPDGKVYLIGQWVK